ncbi:MAG: pentapeptide repeat-containing protein, partial [Planktothrix sp.]
MEKSNLFKNKSYKNTLNVSFPEAPNFSYYQAGYPKLHKLFLVFLAAVLSGIMTIMPFFSAQITIDILLGAFSNIDKFTIIGFVFLGYALLLLSVLNSKSQMTVIFVLIAALTITTFIAVIFEKMPALWGNIFFVFLSLITAALGIFLSSLCFAFSLVCGGIIGNFIAIFTTMIASILININSQIDLSFSSVLYQFIIANTFIFTGEFIAQQSLKGDKKFAWIRDQAVFWAAAGGTSFYGCDLTDACFDGADLPHTDFRQSKLTRASFEGATRLDLSRLQGTILEQPKVRKLLTSKMGVDEDYTGANFNGANLRGAILTGAILAEVQALDADFSGATLTGACIQEWNINKHTRFENVLCEKVYLKCTRKGNGTSILSEPKPDHGTFQPGEFEKWITEIQDTVDLIFQKGLNWKAFAFAMTQTAIDNEGLDVSRYRVEQKGEGVTSVKVGVTPEAQKAEIHQGIVHNYDSAVEMLDRGDPLLLQAKDDKIEEVRKMLESQWQEFREFVNVFSEANRSISIHGEGNRVYILKQAG